MKSIFEILNEMSHQLNSPLASAKSYVYLSKRFLEKNDKEKVGQYLDSLDAKIDLFAKRVEMILTAIQLEVTLPTFTYEFFSLAEIVPGVDIEILADREMLARVFNYVIELTGNESVEVTKAGSNVKAVITFIKRPKPEDKDEKTDLIEKQIIMYQIVKHHRGTIKEENDELTIILPLKPLERK